MSISRATAALTFSLLYLAAAPAVANAETGFIPLTDLGTDLYLNQFQGGLYPGGTNVAPQAHYDAGRSRGLSLLPRDATGAPMASGKIVLLSVGMSHTTQEFGGSGGGTAYRSWTFMGQAEAHPAFDAAQVTMFDGAAQGQVANTWDTPQDANYDRVETALSDAGLAETQVGAAWVKLANIQPTVSLPASDADAHALTRSMADTVRSMRQRYTNLQQVFLSSRSYAGYSTTQLNPEPFAYESGFAVKWLIEAQIREMNTGVIDPDLGSLNYANGTAPWLAWGPYLWADGLTARSDGLTWRRQDFGRDGTHPSTQGETKVGGLLLDFFRTSAFTQPWFTDPVVGDANVDGSVNFDDLLILARQFNVAAGQTWTDGDFTGDGAVTFDDLLALAQNYGVDAESAAREGGSFAGDWALARAIVPEPSILIAIGFTCFRQRRSTAS